MGVLVSPQRKRGKGGTPYQNSSLNGKRGKGKHKELTALSFIKRKKNKDEGRHSGKERRFSYVGEKKVFVSPIGERGAA